MTVSDNLVNFIKQHEEYRMFPYDDLNPDVTIQHPSQVQGTLTIGYGHTHNVHVHDMVTPEEAEQLLRDDIGFAEDAVKVGVNVPLTQNMYDALVSIMFNVGAYNLLDKQYGNNPYEGSTLFHKLNQKKYTEASERFGDFVKSGGQVLNGLVTRRNAEKEMFLSGIGSLTYYDINNGSIVDGYVLDEVDLTKKKSNIIPLVLLLIGLYLMS